MIDALRICLGVLAGGLAVMGALGVLTGSIDLLGLGGCFEEACSPDTRTYEEKVEAALMALGAFVLGAAVCVGLARQS